MLIPFCPWQTIINLSNVDHRTRLIVQHIIFQRVLFFLGLFVPSSDISKLVQNIQTSRGAIVSGIARCIMTLDTPQLSTIFPSQLDILLPTVEPRSTWAAFFLDRGYTLKRSGQCSDHYASSCRYNEVFKSVRTVPQHCCFIDLMCSRATECASCPLLFRLITPFYRRF